MTNLRAVIELLFARANARQELASLFVSDPQQEQQEEGKRERFVAAYQHHFPRRYNDDQVESLYRIVRNEWEFLPGDEESGTTLRTDRRHPLHTLLHFGLAVLREEEGNPVCDYPQLLRWRDLALTLGEELFTTSFLAYRDRERSCERDYFGWNVIIGHNNDELNALFREERLSELHFHLRGSTPLFDLSWIGLMNHTLDRDQAFEALGLSQQPDMLFRPEEVYASLHTLTIWAAAIRAALFKHLIRKEKELPAFLWQLTGTDDRRVQEPHLTELQREIDRLQRENGRLYSGEVVDYAVPHSLPDRETAGPLSLTIYHGERQLLYTAFRHIFRFQPGYRTIRQLLYVYLIAKIRLRAEIVQLNDHRFGFKNFQRHARRTYFIPSGSIYDRLVSNLAIHMTLAPGHIDYIEVRIPPEESEQALHDVIRQFDEEVADPFEPEKRPVEAGPVYPYHYILHFIKEKNETDAAENGATPLFYPPRSYALREKVRRQTSAIDALRKSRLSSRRRIVGIDAASSESDQRPEVFATAYRFLKYHSAAPAGTGRPDDGTPDLGFTYHVGENFWDMADGLRAVHEALLFLHLECGDRLGQVLVLGIEPEYYYRRCHQHVIMSAQNFLDNAAWMLAMLPRTGEAPLPALKTRLEEWFHDYYDRIYGRSHRPVTPELYFQAWLLRGDDPLHYRPRSSPAEPFEPIFTDSWSRAGINEPKSEPRIERTGPIVDLYTAYHYDPDVRTRGRIPVEEQVPEEYVEAIGQIQRFLRRKIAARQLLVETSPSSNYLIGEEKRYDRNPAIKLYPVGSPLAPTLRTIDVSIGTDDQGIFATDLENEYSLLALSLEKSTGPDRKPLYSRAGIYDWLRRIARMSREHRFFPRVHRERRPGSPPAPDDSAE